MKHTDRKIYMFTHDRRMKVEPGCRTMARPFLALSKQHAVTVVHYSDSSR